MNPAMRATGARPAVQQVHLRTLVRAAIVPEILISRRMSLVHKVSVNAIAVTA